MAETKSPEFPDRGPERQFSVMEANGVGIICMMVGGALAGPFGALLGATVGETFGLKAAWDSARRLNRPLR